MRMPERNTASRTLFLRSEEHTSELQSRLHLVCRLLLEKKKSRARRGLLPFAAPGKDHAAHRLANFGLGQRGAVLSLYLFFNDTATTEIYTLSLHDALPISNFVSWINDRGRMNLRVAHVCQPLTSILSDARSEEHTSELQSRLHLVCRL